MIYRIISILQNIWARYRLLVIVNVIGLGAFLFFVLPVILPKPPLEVKTPNLPSAEKTIGGVTVELKMSEPSVPSKLKLHRLITYKQDGEVFADISQRLSLTKSLAPTVRVDETGQESLALDEFVHRLSYSKSTYSNDPNVVPPENNTTPLKLEDAKKLTEDWLEKIGFTDIESNALDTRFYLGLDAYEGYTETEPAKANVIRFTFSRKLDGRVVALAASTSEPAFVTVSNDGVIQADFPAFLATFEADREKELIPFTSVIENVRTGKYTFTSALEAVSEDKSDTEPVKFEVVTATLVYRVDTTQNAAVPYWDLTGTATLRNDQIVPFAITTPAIQL